MAVQLRERLAAARKRRFVGRYAEIELFAAALSRTEPDFAVLHLYGPGGIGKTALLREFARLAQHAGRLVLLLDGRTLEASPSAFQAAISAALAQASMPPNQTITTAPIILVDTYELLSPLDAWLREQFLPELPAQTIIVLAGRHPPAPAWRSDHGWGDLTRIISLRNLHPTESTALLQAHGLAPVLCAQVIEATYGHPLALALAADLISQRSAAATFALAHDPHIVRTLLERFVAELPNPSLRQALELCAHAFTTDEALLIDCLGAEQGIAAFNWLRNLSFIEQGPHGLFPHDLAREVLEVDLRWRNLERFRTVHCQVRDQIIKRIMRSSGQVQQAAIFALLFLHRNNPFMRPFYDWQAFGQLYIEPARPNELPLIEQLILRHQGQASLAAMHYWQAHPGSTVYVFRASGNTMVGFCHILTLETITSADQAADPALAAAANHLASLTPLRPGERLLYFRNWMDAERYQDAPTIFNLCAMISLRLFFGTPQLAYSLIAQANPAYYAEMFSYLRMPMAPAAEFSCDGQTFGAFAHDWRIEPVLTWLDVMGERELLDEIVALETLPQPIQPMALAEPEFAEAVRAALKYVRTPDQLSQNPLLRSRCLRDRAEGEPTPALLQATLREGLAALASNPKTQKLQRVLWHTYFEPAPTQEAAAELLDLPFSTYRHQLGRAIEQIKTWLWQQELYG